MGQWPTPWWLVVAVTERVVAQLPMFAKVLDPACGDGRWLVAAGQIRPDLKLFGTDLDPAAISAARATLASAGVTAELSVADALADPSPLPDVELVVGNPPYVRPQNLPTAMRKDLWSRFATATDKSDLYTCFVERSMATAPRTALVIPDTWLHMASFAALRKAVLQAGCDGVYQLPKKSFDGATVNAVVLLTGPDGSLRAGTLSPDGWHEQGPLGISSDAWSLTGPLPELAGTPLTEFVSIHMGVVCGDYPRYVHFGRSHADDQPTCRGRDVSRWSIADRDEFVRYDPKDMLRRKPYVAPKHAGIFAVPQKLVLAGASGTELRAAMDTEQRFPLDSCYVLLPKQPDLDLYAVLGFLLSAPIGSWYGARHRGARVKGVEVARIPLPSAGWEAVAAAARAQDDEGLNTAVLAAYAAQSDGEG